MDCRPEDKHIIDIKNKNGDAPYYGVINVRETRPLIPEVLESWMERLSSALFGDHCAYKIPEEVILDLEEAQKNS